MPIMTSDLDTLERLAKAAVPMTQSEAAYYEAVSPEVLLSLVARLRQTEATVTELLEGLRKCGGS